MAGRVIENFMQDKTPVTAGITFLSTEVVEVLSINKKYNFVYTEKMENWDKFFNKINKDELDIKKKN